MIVKLRILNKKSIIDFVETEKGVSIQQLLDLKKFYKLRFYYFNYSKISFIDDILDEINIPKEYRIQKPGIDKEKYEIVNKLNYNKMGFINRCKFKGKYKKEQKRIDIKINKQEPTKYKLLRKNHGHKLK